MLLLMAMSSLRLKTSVPLLVTLPVPPKSPVVPPLPTCRVPALIVTPVKLLVPFNVREPVPLLTRVTLERLEAFSAPAQVTAWPPVSTLYMPELAMPKRAV
ncbi:hypothetical protein MCEMAEM4_03363 [Burkholderiaceae bacterium]